MNNLKLVLTTHDDPIQARGLAVQLVEERVAACVNIIPQIESVFYWEGAVQAENELLLIIKTTDSKLAQVKALLEERHGYDVPEMVAIDAEVIHEPFLNWVHECLQI